MAGIDPLSFARAESDVELEYLISVAEKAIQAYEISQKNNAILTINYLGQAFGAHKNRGVQREN